MNAQEALEQFAAIVSEPLTDEQLAKQRALALKHNIPTISRAEALATMRALANKATNKATNTTARHE